MLIFKNQAHISLKSKPFEAKPKSELVPNRLKNWTHMSQKSKPKKV